jgi:xanthine dehydrogenase accessory factor
MHSIDIDVLRTALDWLARGHRVVLGTVVRTWGSAPRPPGSLMVIRGDGQVAGSVSGGCIEDDLIRRVAAGELAPILPELAVYGASAEEAQRFGLPCGGSVQLVLEPLTVTAPLQALLARLANHQRTERHLDLATGEVLLHAATSGEMGVRFDGHHLVTTHGPRLRLLIVGGGQLSRYLAHMAVMLDYQVTVCEPREEYREGWHDHAEVVLSTEMPDDLVVAMQLDENSAAVTLTHDPKLDDLALMEALRTPAFYVGALGSHSNNERRKVRLLDFEVSPTEVTRLHGPVGLRLGGLTPPEIALSILAEMTAVRRGTDVSQPLTNWQGSASICRSA